MSHIHPRRMAGGRKPPPGDKSIEADWGYAHAHAMSKDEQERWSGPTFRDRSVRPNYAEVDEEEDEEEEEPEPKKRARRGNMAPKLRQRGDEGDEEGGGKRRRPQRTSAKEAAEKITKDSEEQKEPEEEDDEEEWEDEPEPSPPKGPKKTTATKAPGYKTSTYTKRSATSTFPGSTRGSSGFPAPLGHFPGNRVPSRPEPRQYRGNHRPAQPSPLQRQPSLALSSPTVGRRQPAQSQTAATRTQPRQGNHPTADVSSPFRSPQTGLSAPLHPAINPRGHAVANSAAFSRQQNPFSRPQNRPGSVGLQSPSPAHLPRSGLFGHQTSTPAQQNHPGAFGPQTHSPFEFRPQTHSHFGPQAHSPFGPQTRFPAQLNLSGAFGEQSPYQAHQNHPGAFGQPSPFLHRPNLSQSTDNSPGSRNSPIVIDESHSGSATPRTGVPTAFQSTQRAANTPAQGLERIPFGPMADSQPRQSPRQRAAMSSNQPDPSPLPTIQLPSIQVSLPLHSVSSSRWTIENAAAWVPGADNNFDPPPPVGLIPPAADDAAPHLPLFVVPRGPRVANQDPTFGTWYGGGYNRERLPENIYVSLNHHMEQRGVENEEDRTYQMAVQHGIGLGIDSFRDSLLNEIRIWGTVFGRSIQIFDSPAERDLNVLADNIDRTAQSHFYLNQAAIAADQYENWYLFCRHARDQEGNLEEFNQVDHEWERQHFGDPASRNPVVQTMVEAARIIRLSRYQAFQHVRNAGGQGDGGNQLPGLNIPAVPGPAGAHSGPVPSPGASSSNAGQGVAGPSNAAGSAASQPQNPSPFRPGADPNVTLAPAAIPDPYLGGGPPDPNRPQIRGFFPTSGSGRVGGVDMNNLDGDAALMASGITRMATGQGTASVVNSRQGPNILNHGYDTVNPRDISSVQAGVGMDVDMSFGSNEAGSSSSGAPFVFQGGNNTNAGTGSSQGNANANTNTMPPPPRPTQGRRDSTSAPAPAPSGPAGNQSGGNTQSGNQSSGSTQSGNQSRDAPVGSDGATDLNDHPDYYALAGVDPAVLNNPDYAFNFNPEFDPVKWDEWIDFGSDNE
ncbi:hypothetical protein F4778DRAFT_792657 [Xylariomycetidae sp. FL2044]|nr:hypothetical protein F4778DRAFT_792657 [Xylariomycetidae sp. FL2044]